MGTSDSPDAVAAELLAALGGLYRLKRNSGADLSLPESSALSRLLHTGPTTLTELAKLEQISSQSLGATIASLEARDLVVRAPDPADGRRSILSVTPAGAARRQARQSSHTRQLTRAARTLSPAERAQLRDALPLLQRIAEELR